MNWRFWRAQPTDIQPHEQPWPLRHFMVIAQQEIEADRVAGKQRGVRPCVDRNPYREQGSREMARRLRQMAAVKA